MPASGLSLLFLHASGLDDLLIALVAVIYMVIFFVLARVKTARQKREKLRHQSQDKPEPPRNDLP